MKKNLSHSQINNDKSLVVSGSKSESNRLLILQQLFPSLQIKNLSDSDDVCAMVNALKSDSQDVVDIHHAGTTMRFLTAYYSLCTERSLILTGSKRMQERPIGVLVDALRQLGAEIAYQKVEGYPPLQINGRISEGGKVVLPANISSQYITALLLVGTKFSKGIELELIGEITSRPYIEMTLELLTQLGVSTSFEGNTIVVKQLGKVAKDSFTVESDWSSASYFYSTVALSPIGTKIQLSSYKKNSLQGDSNVANLYEQIGVKTTYLTDDRIVLEKVAESQVKLSADLVETPDLAQTIAVSCFGLGIECELKGLHTLKIKETDRLIALKNELTKLGANIEVTNDSLYISSSSHINNGIEIETYQDHRMAMAFAPLALRTNIVILEAEVVSKSFIDFWSCLSELGFNIEEQ